MGVAVVLQVDSFFIAYRNFRKATRFEHAIKAAIEDTPVSIVFLTDSGLFHRLDMTLSPIST